MKYFHLIALALLTLFSACQPAGVTPTPPPTQVAVATPLPTATTPPTATFTPSSTFTPSPTVNPITTILAKSTALTYLTFTPTPIFTLTPSSLLPTLKNLGGSSSPDGLWSASFEVLEYPSPNYSQTVYTFKVFRVDGTVEWIIEQKGTDQGGLLGYDHHIALHWSADGQWMYFIHDSTGDGCGPSFYGNDLYRINLQTGAVEMLAAAGHDFKISPDETQAAYLLEETLVILDLTTLTEKVISLNYDPTIEFINFFDTTWAADSSAVVVLGKEDVCAAGLVPLNGRSSIIYIDLSNHVQTVIVNDPLLRKIVSWPEPNQLLIDYDYKKSAWVNLQTGEITLQNE